MTVGKPGYYCNIGKYTRGPIFVQVYRKVQSNCAHELSFLSFGIFVERAKFEMGICAVMALNKAQLIPGQSKGLLSSPSNSGQVKGAGEGRKHYGFAGVRSRDRTKVC